MKPSVLVLFVLCVLPPPARANVIGIGLDWRKKVFVQEYWQGDKPRYVIANLNKGPVTIGVHQWKRQQTGAALAGPWTVKAGAVLDVDASRVKDNSFVMWQLADGTELGILPPPQAADRKTGKRIVTYCGMNDSGGTNFDLYCDQAKTAFPSGGTIEIRLMITSKIKGTLTFRKKRTIDALPEAPILEAKCATLPIKAGDAEVQIDATRPLKEVPVHEVTLRFEAPRVEQPAMVVFNGSVMLSTGGGFGLTRGVLVKPEAAGSR